MKKLMLMLFIATSLFSCSEQELTKIEDESVSETNFAATMRTFSGDSLVLKNPYSLENMRLALNTIKSKDKASSYLSNENFQINASHLYVKFKPRNLEEEGLLKADSTMHLFDYRLDVEYKSSFLDNRKVKGDSIPDYYTAIPINKALPNVPYETLEQLYIPEQDKYFADTREIEKYLITDKISNKTDLYNHLIFNAFAQTKNEKEVLEPSSTATQRWFFGKRWRPKGTIRIWDDHYKNIPLEGAKILMRQWFTIDSGITDGNGYFQTGTVRGHARYIIQWERYQYSIRSGSGGQAELRGPNLKNQDWNHTIEGYNTQSKDEYYGHIHRAAHHYYYKDIQGLNRPHQNGFWRPQMKIAAKYEPNSSSNGTHHSLVLNPFGLFNNIKIYNPQNLSYQIYASTIHELTHSAHFTANKLKFILTNDKVKESWARGVQGVLTRMTYPNYLEPEIRPEYTLVVRDLIDNNYRYGDTEVTGDLTSGYTIKQLENSLGTTWNQWRINIINDHTNNSEQHVQDTFNFWN
jgi:hypothetical protein